MRHERLFLCGRRTQPDVAESPTNTKEVPLLLWGERRNITLKISDITKKMIAELSELFIDLLEIATYVYCADQATPRGGSGVSDVGSKWRRNLNFKIQVRKPDFWSRSDVTETLEDTLSFLSDDDYSFGFSELTDPPPVDTYLDFSQSESSFFADEVVPFSGGLDSLAGAIQEIFGNEHRVALVSHRSAPKIAPKQKALHREICSRCSRELKPLHVPIWIHKHGWDAADDSQRSRSFLYASLAASVAVMFGKRRIRFYENGVTSLNLPIAEQLIGARATRTTHPKSMAGFQKLFSLMNNEDFLVETPFMWMTKADVLNTIKSAGLADLVKYAVSCSHVFAMTRLATHCGCCSQCIDRRLAVFAAECPEHDPKGMYKVDVFTGKHDDEGQEIVLAESYVRTMRAMADIQEMQFFYGYGEVSRVVDAVPGASDDVAEKIFQLYRRNGKQVEHAIKNALTYYANDLAKLELPDQSLFRQLFGAKVPGESAPVEISGAEKTGKSKKRRPTKVEMANRNKAVAMAAAQFEASHDCLPTVDDIIAETKLSRNQVYATDPYREGKIAKSSAKIAGAMTGGSIQRTEYYGRESEEHGRAKKRTKAEQAELDALIDEQEEEAAEDEKQQRIHKKRSPDDD